MEDLKQNYTKYYLKLKELCREKNIKLLIKNKKEAERAKKMVEREKQAKKQKRKE